MKGLFCFDGPMYCDINNVYCNTTLTNEVFNRYLKVCDNLTVIIRTFHTNKSAQEMNLHEINLNRLNIIEIPNLNTIRGLIYDRHKIYKKLLEIVKDSDLIFARMPSIISDLIIDIAIKIEKPYLVEVGGCVWDAYWNHDLKGKFIAPYLFVKARKNIRNASVAIYVTEKFLQKRYPNKSINGVCSNVNLPKFDDNILVNRIKKIKNKSNSLPIIIGTTAAVDVRYKGQEYVIKAIARLNKIGFNFEYELIGVGDNFYLESVAKKHGIADKVRFLGVKKHDFVIEWLDSIDIYAQPSKQEGLPRALIEAMSRGCPSIGSDIAGIPELLTEDCIFKSGNISNICEILKGFSDKKMMQLAKLNFNISKKFDRDIIEDRRLKLFQNYLKILNK